MSDVFYYPPIYEVVFQGVIPDDPDWKVVMTNVPVYPLFLTHVNILTDTVATREQLLRINIGGSLFPLIAGKANPGYYGATKQQHNLLYEPFSIESTTIAGTTTDIVTLYFHFEVRKEMGKISGG